MIVVVDVVIEIYVVAGDHREGHEFYSCQLGALCKFGFSRWGPGVQFESGESGAVAVVCGINNQPALDWVPMDIALMVDEVLIIPNAMICKAPLPNFPLATEYRTEGMRVSAFNQLDSMFERHVAAWREEKMDMFRHEYECM
ncbi:MAG TPA: hypothetical protein VFA67_06895 [Candidatus Sulfotelmatobacter sp.]|nr:hypothetical protein [Candidatus Sulfotelmatobacter sp.]